MDNNINNNNNENKFEVKLKSELFNHDNENMVRRDNNINSDKKIGLIYISVVLFVIFLVVMLVLLFLK